MQNFNQEDKIIGLTWTNGYAQQQDAGGELILNDWNGDR